MIIFLVFCKTLVNIFEFHCRVTAFQSSILQPKVKVYFSILPFLIKFSSRHLISLNEPFFLCRTFEKHIERFLANDLGEKC